jgi:O-antigen/teichoic acid export membrane protein
MDVMHVSTSSIGRYNVAYTVANFISSLGNASGKAISPLLNGFYKIGDDKSARNLIFVLQGCFFVMTFILCLWMKELFSFLIRNENLAQMYYLGIILVMAYNYRPMYYGANAKLMFAEKTNVLWKVTFGAGLINIILNLLLIPIFGFEVAAITTFIGYMFMGYSGFYFKVFKEINSANYYPLFWIAMNVVITVITYFAVELPFGYKIIMSLLSGALGILFVLRMNKFFKKQ